LLHMHTIAERRSLRLAATLLFGGEILFALAGFFHPAREYANNHVAVFAEYANSSSWTLIHLGQFAGMVVVVAGLVVLSPAVGAQSGAPGWLARLGVVSAVATLALSGVLQAVDGVALKQAVDAWFSAPDAEKAARFASAESIRWLEWGARSYQSFMLGLTFVLLAVVIALTGKVPRAIGYLMALSGIAYLAQGWVVGSQGFASANSVPTLVAYTGWLAWSIWLMFATWLMKDTAEDR
jgi:hypothetical protein